MHRLADLFNRRPKEVRAWLSRGDTAPQAAAVTIRFRAGLIRRGDRVAILSRKRRAWAKEAGRCAEARIRCRRRRRPFRFTLTIGNQRRGSHLLVDRPDRDEFVSGTSWRVGRRGPVRRPWRVLNSRPALRRSSRSRGPLSYLYPSVRWPFPVRHNPTLARRAGSARRCASRGRATEHVPARTPVTLAAATDVGGLDA